jgi:hypothetical protein
MIRKLRNSPINKEAYGPGAEIAAEVIYRQMLVHAHQIIAKRAPTEADAQTSLTNFGPYPVVSIPAPLILREAVTQALNSRSKPKPCSTSSRIDNR